MYLLKNSIRKTFTFQELPNKPIVAVVQCIKSCRYGPSSLVNVHIGGIYYLCDINHGLIVGER